MPYPFIQSSYEKVIVLVIWTEMYFGRVIPTLKVRPAKTHVSDLEEDFTAMVKS